MIVTALAAIALLYVLRIITQVYRSLASVGYLSGQKTLLPEESVASILLPPIRGISLGNNHALLRKHSVYSAIGWDAISQVSIWPPTVQLKLADAHAIKEVTSSRSRFPKSLGQEYELLSFFGRNIVSTEGEEWKKYRKIAAPAFNDRNNRLVWDETVKVVSNMFTQVWKDQDYTTDHVVDMTIPLALFIISAAGFGHEMSWLDKEIIPAGHQMTLKDALHTVAAGAFERLFFPDWVLMLTKRLRRVKLSFEELDRYLHEMIEARKTSDKVARYDLFNGLIDANEAGSDDSKLTERELKGNIFIFLLAGHETTAHTLAFTFALLALHQDEQEKLYEHVKKVNPDGSIPTYEQMPLLTYSLAVLYETLRMFPPVQRIPKMSTSDTTLTTYNVRGEKLLFPVPQGTTISVHTPGLHNNPRYWEDPGSFNPSRFLRDDWERDAFLAFSAGVRGCIGRKFFETEAVAILSILVSKYKIEVKPDPQFANETFDERKKRILACKLALTTTPLCVPLVFKRR